MAEPSELESFRQQWRAEVRARASASTTARGAGPASRPAEQQQPKEKKPKPRPVEEVLAGLSGSAGPRPSVPEALPMRPAGKKPVLLDVDDDDDDGSDVGVDSVGRRYSFGEEAPAVVSEDGHTTTDEPRSALEHYEKAVEREEQGGLGDSVRLYRQAFRMDSTVDKKYKNKHFPAKAKGPERAPDKALETKTAQETTKTAPAAAPPPPPPSLLPMKELLASFAGLAIEPAPPPVEGDPAPPCPLAALPDELLVHVLRDVAVADVGDFVRLAQVCKRLAYLVATEDGIWRRVCVGGEFGFAAMHRTWQRTIVWGDEPDADPEGDAAASLATTLALGGQRLPKSLRGRGLATGVPSPVYPSWQTMFRRRPRVRFNGVYISTVNYIRSGQGTNNRVTWINPVLIVTYFRYLRFFRDGTVISLVTTTEPADVVHHLTKDLLALHQGGAMPNLSSAVMQSAYKGRWRLSGWGPQGSEEGGEEESGSATTTTTAAAAAPPSTMAAAAETESDLTVETEGVGKYNYRMELSVRSAGKGARHTKLAWRGFYSYDRLTDDWGEFGLKNDRPFFFSRVKRYGVGG